MEPSLKKDSRRATNTARTIRWPISATRIIFYLEIPILKVGNPTFEVGNPTL